MNDIQQDLVHSHSVSFEEWKACVLRNLSRKKSSLNLLVNMHKDLVSNSHGMNSQHQTFKILSLIFSDKNNDHFCKVEKAYGCRHCEVLSSWYERLAVDSSCD